jgi:hypothetical protein
MVRVLRTRSHGDDVAFVQEQLNARPPTALPPLAVDGVFGPRTLCRVKEFQTTTGLTASGIVGRATWGKLLGYTAATTPGFCVLGRHLYDRLGTRVLLRGVNKMSVWDNEDPDGATSFGEIRQTGANTVRIVWAMTTDLSPNGPATSLSALDVLLTNAKGNHLIPMIELHDATCQWGRLDDLVRYWTQPATVAVVTKHQAYVLVNIGNEVGDDTVTQAEFVAGYAAAIRRLRGAGCRHPITEVERVTICRTAGARWAPRCSAGRVRGIRHDQRRWSWPLPARCTSGPRHGDASNQPATTAGRLSDRCTGRRTPRRATRPSGPGGHRAGDPPHSPPPGSAGARSPPSPCPWW